jgi:tetratricopeptide (TPR) repeat protein
MTKRNAERSLDEAIAAIQQSINLNDNSADAHSLLAGLYGRKISFGGFMAGARYGPKNDAENKKAVALDPNNPRVYASLGGEYLHAPKMFGGDVDKAIESFRKATQLDATNDENFVWLALAYRKKGDTANADKALQEALRINPRSAFAKSVAAAK